MKKKSLLLVIIIGSILFSEMTIAQPLNEINKTSMDNNPNESVFRGDMLDQYQTQQNYSNSVGTVGSSLNYSVAQSFTPTYPVLTRVELFIEKSPNATIPYYVVIRDNLTGSDLTKVGVSPDEIDVNFSWVEFDFKDLAVTPGATYYIVSYTTRAENNRYSWGFHYPDVYFNGTSFLRLSPDHPYDNQYVDCTFKTYGRTNTPPGIPEQPDGPTEGIVNVAYTYTTSATDPDNESLEYGWDWNGNDSVDEWTSENTASHVWTEGDVYDVQVKARDEIGEESDFSDTLTVNIIGETELSIEFVKSGFGGLSVVIKNIGEYEAVDILWNLNITGGILGLINTYIEGDADVLPVGDEITVELPMLFGLGPLKIVAIADAANADEVTETWNGFILFIFIF